MDSIDSETDVFYAVRVGEEITVYRGARPPILLSDSVLLRSIVEYELPVAIATLEEDDGVNRYINGRINNYYRVSDSLISFCIVINFLLLLMSFLYARNLVKQNN